METAVIYKQKLPLSQGASGQPLSRQLLFSDEWRKTWKLLWGRLILERCLILHSAVRPKPDRRVKNAHEYFSVLAEVGREQRCAEGPVAHLITKWRETLREERHLFFSYLRPNRDEFTPSRSQAFHSPTYALQQCAGYARSRVAEALVRWQ